MTRARSLFSSCCVSDDETCEEIGRVWRQCAYMLDPHSAIGTFAARDSRQSGGNPMVTLATAHPAKFPAAVAASGIAEEPALPPHLADLFARPEKFTVLPNDLDAVQRYMVETIPT